MNYTKLTINETEIGLKFGMPAARYLASKSNNPFLYDGEDLTEIGIAHVIYAGYVNNCAHKDIAPEITFEQVADYVETCIGDKDKSQSLVDVITIWLGTDFMKTAVAEPEGTKKKKIGTKSKGLPTK